MPFMNRKGLTRKQFLQLLEAGDAPAQKWLREQYNYQLRKKLTGSSRKYADDTYMGQLTEELVNDGVAEAWVWLRDHPDSRRPLFKVLQDIATEARKQIRGQRLMRIDDKEPVQTMEPSKIVTWMNEHQRSRYDPVEEEVQASRRWLGARAVLKLDGKLPLELAAAVRVKTGLPVSESQARSLARTPTRARIDRRYRVGLRKVKDRIIKPGVKELPPHVQVRLPDTRSRRKPRRKKSSRNRKQPRCQPGK